MTVACPQCHNRMHVKCRCVEENRELVVLVCDSCARNETLTLYGAFYEDTPDCSLLGYVRGFMDQKRVYELLDIMDR